MVSTLTTTIPFFRHGSTDFPEDMVYIENAGHGLNREGIIQAENLARWAVGQGISYVYTSPSQRAMETARVIAASINMSPTIDDSLRGKSLGIWESLSIKKIASIYEDYNLWKDANPTFAPDKGESTTDLATRVKKAINMILRSIKEGRLG